MTAGGCTPRCQDSGANCYRLRGLLLVGTNIFAQCPNVSLTVEAASCLHPVASYLAADFAGLAGQIMRPGAVGLAEVASTKEKLTLLDLNENCISEGGVEQLQVIAPPFLGPLP